MSVFFPDSKNTKVFSESSEEALWGIPRFAGLHGKVIRIEGPYNTTSHGCPPLSLGRDRDHIRSVEPTTIGFRPDVDDLRDLDDLAGTVANALLFADCDRKIFRNLEIPRRAFENVCHDILR